MGDSWRLLRSGWRLIILFLCEILSHFFLGALSARFEPESPMRGLRASSILIIYLLPEGRSNIGLTIMARRGPSRIGAGRGPTLGQGRGGSPGAPWVHAIGLYLGAVFIPHPGAPSGLGTNTASNPSRGAQKVPGIDKRVVTLLHAPSRNTAPNSIKALGAQPFVSSTQNSGLRR